MKIFTLSIFFCFFIFTTLFADINPDEIRLINQRLENILRESRDMPQHKKIRIISEVKSIQRLLADPKKEKEQIDENNNERPDNWKKADDFYHPENSTRAVIRLYDPQSFKDLKVRIKSAWPFRDQLVLIKRINKTSSFTVRQILEITKLLDFPNDQKEVAILLLPNSSDLENIDILYDLFGTKSDREKINKIADEYLH